MNAITTRAGAASLAPQTWEQALQFADLLARSSMVPKDFAGKPGNVMVAIQWGAEVGLSPLQAVQNIAVINGRPSIWGDAALALVRGHPACAGIREGVEGEGDARHGWCEVTRRGEQPQKRTFSVADAKRANLWGKAGPWQQYPDRMLQLRARGFAIRDVFPDALRGVITAEEARDMPPEPRDVQSTVVEDAPAKPAGELSTYARSLTETVEKWPVLAPDGVVAAVPRGSWVRAVTRALAKMPTAAKVEEWRAAMGEHLASVSEADADAAAAALEAITARLAELMSEAIDFPGDQP